MRQALQFPFICFSQIFDLLLIIAFTAGPLLASAELLNRGDEHAKRPVEALAAARCEIAVELYQVEPDAIGRQLCGALAKVGEHGVRHPQFIDSLPWTCDRL